MFFFSLLPNDAGMLVRIWSLYHTIHCVFSIKYKMCTTPLAPTRKCVRACVRVCRMHVFEQICVRVNILLIKIITMIIKTREDMKIYIDSVEFH